MRSGILPVDKPAGMTSHTVISVLRRLTGVRRIGHSGTLDPMATGVLPVCIGRATRAADFVADSRKQYVAELTLGVETDTEDSTGTVLATHPVEVSEAAVREALGGFVGDILQVPPMYSALQRDGKRLYDLAREGIVVERAPRPVTVYALTLESFAPPRCVMRIDCSKGTYVRTLCSDIGRALGCGGMMSGLRRTLCGGFSADQAYTLDELREAAEAGRLEELLRDTETVFASWPRTELTAEGEHRLRNGAPAYFCHMIGDPPTGRVRICGPGGFLGIGRVRGTELVCEKSFFETLEAEE